MRPASPTPSLLPAREYYDSKGPLVQLLPRFVAKGIPPVLRENLPLARLAPHERRVRAVEERAEACVVEVGRHAARKGRVEREKPAKEGEKFGRLPSKAGTPRTLRSPRQNCSSVAQLPSIQSQSAGPLLPREAVPSRSPEPNLAVLACRTSSERMLATMRDMLRFRRSSARRTLQEKAGRLAC